jgi:2-polyprenyl-3-methyl-5-hydroxy-6-metoxy-1,4-benzoquinol methylase
LNPNFDRQILDVGCGLGGTADYLYSNGYGNVTGIDIDPELIDYAQSKYPYINFETLPAEKAASYFKKHTFHLVYFFSSMYCMENKKQVIDSIRPLIKPDGYLIIFDYIMGVHYQGENPFSDNQTKSFEPLSLSEMEKFFTSNRWQIDRLEDLSQEFLSWYMNVLAKLNQNREYLAEQYTEQCFNRVYKRFSSLVDLINSKRLGGGTITAKN